MLALRDEIVSRAFDPPGAWWPDQPDTIGGRDRHAGGSWCVSDVATGVTAVVLNRPERQSAAVGAPSRGVLPIVAIRERENWPASVDTAPMAGFNLVLASPQSLLWWSFDGQELRRHSLSEGTHLFTPDGLQSAPTDQRLATGGAAISKLGAAAIQRASTEQLWDGWLAAVRDCVPTADRSGLVVRRPIGDDSYETVFGQFIAAWPGLLRLDYLDRVARDAGRQWTTKQWTTKQRVSTISAT